MKKNLIIILLFFLFVRVGDINAKENLPELGKDYGFLGLNDNVVNYQWKIDSVRKTNEREIYRNISTKPLITLSTIVT